MTKYNANNERIKRKYLTFLKQAKGQNEASIDAVAKALVRFESYNKYKEFRAFHFEQAIGFKKHLANQLHYKAVKKSFAYNANDSHSHFCGNIKHASSSR